MRTEPVKFVKLSLRTGLAARGLGSDMDHKATSVGFCASEFQKET